MSDYGNTQHIQLRWTAGAYFQILDLLDYVSKLPDDSDSPVSPYEARVTRNALVKYTTIKRRDLNNVTDDTIVYVHLYPDEVRCYERLNGFASAGGFWPDWRYPDVDPAGYVDALVAKCKGYYAARDAVWDAKEARMLQRIRDYVAECKASGKRPVKRRLVDEQNNYAYVLTVWKQYDKEVAAKNESAATEDGTATDDGTASQE